MIYMHNKTGEFLIADIVEGSIMIEMSEKLEEYLQNHRFELFGNFIVKECTQVGLL